MKRYFTIVILAQILDEVNYSTKIGLFLFTSLCLHFCPQPFLISSMLLKLIFFNILSGTDQQGNQFY